MRFAKKGPFVGILITMISALLYYNVYLISSQILSKQPWMVPAIGVWIPDILLIFISALSLRRIE